MHWILQENLFKESEWENLVGCLERFKIPYSVHKVIPFIGELMPAPDLLALHAKKVVCFGSYSMRHAAKEHRWYPGVYDLEPITFEVQRQHWGDLMLNADSIVVPFGDVVYDDDIPLFMRPIEDSKVFAGKVFERDEFNEWQKKVCVLEEDYGTSLTKNTLVQVCSPKKIYTEYRFWIVDGAIVTRSLYKRGDRVIYSSDVDEHVIQFVCEIIKYPGWQPHRAYVLDVCETLDGMRIVEINTINSAGFYAADVTALVMALERMEGK